MDPQQTFSLLKLIATQAAFIDRQAAALAEFETVKAERDKLAAELAEVKPKG